MIPFVNKIYHFGSQALSEEYKISAVKISNIIAFIFLMTGVIYGVISAFLAPQLISVCVLLFTGSLIILALNYLEMVDVSRIALTLLISLDVSIYHAFIVGPGESLIVSIYIGQLVVAILPWIYIDIRENRILVTSLSITFLIFTAQPWTNELLNIEIDSSIFREKIFTIPTYTFSIAALLFSMYLLQNKNLNTEKGNFRLLEDIRNKNQEMKMQQEQLLKTLDENKISREAEEKRNWISKGVAEIGNILRGDVDERFYQQLVSTIVTYMKVNQAGLYTVEENNDNIDGDRIIEMKSCYAFDRIKFLKKRIEIGNGLIGQCYLEKEKIYIKEVPESYINITSGLGDANPRSLLIVPLIHEENVEGLIEIASFKEMADYEIEFVEKLSEILASYIARNRINQQTKFLLEQSQQQSEEMRAQEEEMRQNMEELQAIQEEMKRKEQENLERIEELENAQTTGDVA